MGYAVVAMAVPVDLRSRNTVHESSPLAATAKGARHLAVRHRAATAAVRGARFHAAPFSAIVSNVPGPRNQTHHASYIFSLLQTNTPCMSRA